MYTSIITLPNTLTPGTYTLRVVDSAAVPVQTISLAVAGGTPPTGMTNGVPNWLYAVGFARIVSDNQASLYIDTALAPSVQLDQTTGTSTGDGWSTGVARVGTPNALGRYNYVIRLNKVSGSGTGMVSGTTYSVKLTNPATPSENITLSLTISNTNTSGIELIPLNPTSITTAPVSSSNLDTYLGSDLVYTGEKIVGFNSNPILFDIDANLVNNKVFPFNKLSIPVPDGYTMRPRINGEFYNSFTDPAFVGCEQGKPCFVEIFYPRNDLSRADWATMSLGANIPITQSQITIY